MILSSRLDYVDRAKGVMILLVIVGHICQYDFCRGKDEPLFRFIYSFHMPLFFLLSGYVMGVSRQKLQSQPFRTWLWRKVQTLLIPFVIWGLFIYRYIDPIGKSPLDVEALRQLIVIPYHNGAWFLISLFCVQMVCYPVFRYNKYYVWCVPLLFLAIGSWLGGSFFYCNPHHYLSFLAGYLIFKYKDRIFCADVATTALLAFVLAEIVYPHPLICTISAGITLLFVCQHLCVGGGKTWLANQINTIGRNTMVVYLLHFFLLFQVRLDVSGFRQALVLTITLGIAFIVAMVCVHIARVISCFPFLSLLLFGKRSK